MIVAPMTLEARPGIYAVMPNSKRLGGFIPEKSYIFADASAKPAPGDLAVFLDADFATLDADTAATAQVAVVRTDTKGRIYGQVTTPEEKVSGKTIHKVIMIVME